MAIFADVDWTALGIIGTLVVSFLGSIFGLYQARKADRSATTTRTIELGVKDLIDQYQERQKELKSDVEDCTERCRRLQQQADDLKSELARATTHIDNLEVEVIRLKRATGEIT